MNIIKSNESGLEKQGLISKILKKLNYKEQKRIKKIELETQIKKSMINLGKREVSFIKNNIKFIERMEREKEEKKQEENMVKKALINLKSSVDKIQEKQNELNLKFLIKDAKKRMENINPVVINQ